MATARHTDPAAALASRRENSAVVTNTLADQIRQMESQFALAMPRGAEATQLVRDAITALRTTRKLADCEAASVLGSLMTCAQLGLRPGVLGHAWLLPFWDRKANEGPDGKSRGGYRAQLVIGYQGLIELAHRSGKVLSLIARTVFEGDEFDVDYGLEDRLIHKPNLTTDQGKPVAYYAIAKFVGGGHAFMVMTHRQMLVYRDKHATAKTKEGVVFGPWKDHFEGMAQKTCVRQLAKYMPKSTDLAIALAVDEGVRVDLTPNMDVYEATQHPVFDGEVIDEPDPGAASANSGDPWDTPPSAKPGDAAASTS